jgi:DNA-entry nuclease
LQEVAPEVGDLIDSGANDTGDANDGGGKNTYGDAPSINGYPTYAGNIYAEIDENSPAFEDEDITADPYEYYSPLDTLGRCGVAMACVGLETMPKDGEKRGSISSVYPTGWVQAKYDSVKGGYLYNRCHLIGWQLTAENANKQNLVTGTKSLNNDGMLPFENRIAAYVKGTNNHVLYRVTPIFGEDNLLCFGIQLEAFSVEDDGAGIYFNVFIYNVQSGINIDYKTGESSLCNSTAECERQIFVLLYFKKETVTL